MIILLAAVNIFMAVMLAGSTATEVYDSSAVKNITELLSSGGIAADESFLNTDYENARVFVCHLDENYSAAVAKKLMGEYDEVFSTPNGTEFFSQKSRLKIGNEMEIEYSDGNFDIANIRESEEMTSSEVEQLNEVLSNVFGTGGFKLFSSEKDGSFISARIVQRIDGLNVENNTLKCVFDEGSLVFLEGKWCFASIDESFSAHTLDSVNILFIEKNELAAARAENADIPETLTVKNMSRCYCSHISADGTKAYFMPSWHIEWLENEMYDSFYNAVNGEKTVFEQQY